jgi:hypothetical protein
LLEFDRRSTESSSTARASTLGRSSRPARTFARGLETEIAWKVTFGGCSLAEGTSNGECRIYHPDDAKAAVRNHVMSGMSPEDWYNQFSWIYGGNGLSN